MTWAFFKATTVELTRSEPGYRLECLPLWLGTWSLHIWYLALPNKQQVSPLPRPGVGAGISCSESVEKDSRYETKSKDMLQNGCAWRDSRLLLPRLQVHLLYSCPSVSVSSGFPHPPSQRLHASLPSGMYPRAPKCAWLGVSLRKKHS